MGLPFEPETEESLRARFPEAMGKVFDAKAVAASRPGQERRYVFDFYDGMRLVASREMVDGEVCLHVSVSFHMGTDVSGEALVRVVVDKVNALRGFRVPGLVRAFESPGGVAHFVFPELPKALEGVVMPPWQGAN